MKITRAILLLCLAYLGSATPTNLNDLKLIANSELSKFPKAYPSLHGTFHEIQTHPQLKGFYPLCGTCEALFGTVLNQATLQSYATQIETKVCGQLPAQAQPQCQDLFANYTQEVISYILINFNAKDVCEDFEMCSNATTLAASYPKRKVSVNPCTSCKQSISILQGMFSKANVRGDLQKFVVDHFCSSVPVKNFESRCAIFGHAMLPTLIRGFISGLSSDNTCRVVGAC